MRNDILIGSTSGTSLELPAEALGAPGVHCDICICPRLIGDTDEDDERRRSDTDTRHFDVKALLGKSPVAHHHLNFSFGPEDGNSYIQAGSAVSYLLVDSPAGQMRLSVNKAHEVSMASASIFTNNPLSARAIFDEMLNRYLDRMSYLAGIPTHVIFTVTHDKKNEIQTIFYVSPPRPTLINDGGEELNNEMKPIYALYREAMNSTSPYYRLLCLFKIIEGLIGPLRSNLRKRERSAGIDLNMGKDLVPDHPEFPMRFQRHVGTSIKAFQDAVLTKEYRDAMAHFSLRTGKALDVSTLQDNLRFADAAFSADLCARALIAKHDQYLSLLSEASFQKGSLTTGSST